MLDVGGYVHATWNFGKWVVWPCLLASGSLGNSDLEMSAQRVGYHLQPLVVVVVMVVMVVVVVVMVVATAPRHGTHFFSPI